MPLPEHLEYDPDATESSGGKVRPKQDGFRCPECGTDLTGQNPVNHSRQHWPERWDPNNPPSDQAVARRKQLEGMREPQANTEDTPQ